MTISLWLDCDPGHDDALAIILAGYSQSLRLIGISTIAGNTTVENTTDNALRILSAINLPHIPVVKGQSKPLLRPPLLCPEIHGNSGLDGPGGANLFPPSDLKACPGPAPICMYKYIRENFQENGRIVKLVATGALTNVALMFALYPEVLTMIEVVIMGGCLGVGNTGPVMEFNIQTDPEAAKLVFESGVPLCMVPLEVTHTVLATTSILDRIEFGTPFKATIRDLLTFFAKTYKEVFDFDHPPVHDPCAVAYLLAPQAFTKVRRLRVDIETSSILTAGQTVVDVWNQSGKAPNCDVCIEMDHEKFWDVMIAAISAADDRVQLAMKNV